MAPTGEARKRKACQSCIRAKARCYFAESSGNECTRCARLGKSCVAEEVAKRTVKPRSRVRQLEKRVESLIDMLASGNGAAPATNAPEALPGPIPESTLVNTESASASVRMITVEQEHAVGRDDCNENEVLPPIFKGYDPIAAGVIDPQHAEMLLHEFKTMFGFSFPFVVVTEDLEALRAKKPFLLHAILAATSYASPRIQHQLGDELKRQVARLIEFSQKGLDILQGLLLYAAWYHAFYHPATQQLGTIIQLCVAMVQDLDLTKGHKTRFFNPPGTPATNEERQQQRSFADYRALLGTYCLSVSYAQSWRKRPTLPYTRFMTKCCEHLTNSTVPTDVLITPLVQLSELVARVTDFFSYDDLENAEFKGTMMLEMATNNYRTELERIRSSTMVNEMTKLNTTLSLSCHLTDVWINECALHHELWRAEPSRSSSQLSSLRVRMLHRAMYASKSYIEILNNSPRSILYHLSLSTWAAWFYIVAVTCKLVFLQDTDTPEGGRVDSLEGEINSLFNNAPRYTRKPLHSDEGLIWDPVRVAQESQIESVFLTFRTHLEIALPLDSAPWSREKQDRDALYSIACLHQILLQGFTKRLAELTSTARTSESSVVTLNPTDSLPTPISKIDSTHDSIIPAQTASTSSSSSNKAMGRSALIAGFMHFDSINFDGIQLPPELAGQWASMDDWIWNSALDGFTMPSL